MKIFLICPVRNIDVHWKEILEEYVKSLEATGNRVYWPSRDTDQNDSVGFRICTDNKKGILWADEIHIAWDGKSEGCLFDIGMAFMAGKKVKIIERLFPMATPHKSFPTMIRYWAEGNGGKDVYN
ncbi:hypothetical protein A2Z67_04660 [Candidatus Woesebacteria bacterium RBG_13_36_22]|uniref:Nucleoside 2-deoxyribosyltransferase n=1 Tax=Candidatus Woesebacteria bacterium RBG_13_36_22 TaxID=1802478 RepID=A0A1F7X283_9BACT|nr:MAG: hypothetical protein A2Z67_04660 [Candidatus Woesebacteria bacterium RBG_13_36_22]